MYVYDIFKVVTQFIYLNSRKNISMRGKIEKKRRNQAIQNQKKKEKQTQTQTIT